MKIRLNKKTIDELSAGQALSTLKTKQKQIKEDITTYVDEPFLKPENIRHGITMAGVDGKYLHEVKYVNIYNVEGNHLRTLASTEPTPEIKTDNDNIILTNKPFENQRTYGTYEAYIKESSDSIVQLSNTPIKLNESSTNLVAIEKSNYSTQGVYTSISDYNTNPYVNFYESVITDPETGSGFSITDQAILDNSGRNALKYTFQGSSYHPNCFIEYMNLQYVGVGDSTLTESGISVTQSSTSISARPYTYYETTITFPEEFDLNDPTVSFGIRAYSSDTMTTTDSWNVCYKSGGYGLILGDDAIVVPDANGSFFERGCKIDKNTITFVLDERYTFIGDGQEHSFKPDAFDIHIARVCNNLPGIVVENAFKNVPESTDINIPYYVELPTKAYELGFNEDVTIGETSRMLIQRNSNYMEYTHYLSNLESAAPGLHKVSDTSFDTSRVTVYETFSQRITVQYLEYDYSTIANSKVANHCELRVIEDSRTGEFRRTAFSNTGCGSSSTYDGGSFDNSAFIMLYDNAGTPSNLYKQSSTELKRWGGAMGFVYKLADGSFFIIDGGMGGTNEGYKNYRSQAPTLFNALKAYANDPNNIRIAGWLLTHSHQDHVGVFCEFMENTDYKSKISIDKVIYSLPVEKFSAFKVTKAAATRTEFETVLDILRAEGKTEIIKAHMGHIFNIQNLELTILSAPENVYRSYDSLTGNIISDLDNLNDTCVVCKVYCYSKNIFYLADAHKNQFQAHIVPALLGYIKSNIYGGGLQVAHHGYVDTNGKLLYDQLNESISLPAISQPEFILWPVSYEHFSGKKTDGSVYQETEGTDYTGVYNHSKNAALKDIKAIYPRNNYSMVATPNTIGEWTFTAIDFVDPCTHTSEPVAVYHKWYDTSWKHHITYSCPSCWEPIGQDGGDAGCIFENGVCKFCGALAPSVTYNSTSNLLTWDTYSAGEFYIYRAVTTTSSFNESSITLIDSVQTGIAGEGDIYNYTVSTPAKTTTGKYYWYGVAYHNISDSSIVWDTTNYEYVASSGYTYKFINNSNTTVTIKLSTTTQATLDSGESKTATYLPNNTVTVSANSPIEVPGGTASNTTYKSYTIRTQAANTTIEITDKLVLQHTCTLNNVKLSWNAIGDSSYTVYRDNTVVGTYSGTSANLVTTTEWAKATDGYNSYRVVGAESGISSNTVDVYRLSGSNPKSTVFNSASQVECIMNDEVAANYTIYIQNSLGVTVDTVTGTTDGINDSNYTAVVNVLDHGIDYGEVYRVYYTMTHPEYITYVSGEYYGQVSD